MTTHKLSLEEVMTSPELLEHFSVYVEEDLNYEALEFLQASHTYAAMFVSDEYDQLEEDRLRRAVSIFDK